MNLTKSQREVLALMNKIGSKWVQDRRAQRSFDKLYQEGFLTCESAFRDSGTWYHITEKGKQEWQKINQ